MDQASAGLVGALIGSASGLLGGLSLEAFRRRRDRQAVAMAIAGAIETELWLIERRGHVEFFQSSLDRLRRGETLTFFGFVREEDARNPVIDAYADKLGMLTGELAADVIRFSQTMWGLRVDAGRLVAGKLGDNSTIIKIIEQDLGLMAEMSVFGRDLVRRLKRSAGN